MIQKRTWGASGETHLPRQPPEAQVGGGAAPGSLSTWATTMLAVRAFGVTTVTTIIGRVIVTAQGQATCCVTLSRPLIPRDLRWARKKMEGAFPLPSRGLGVSRGQVPWGRDRRRRSWWRGQPGATWAVRRTSWSQPSAARFLSTPPCPGPATSSPFPAVAWVPVSIPCCPEKPPPPPLGTEEPNSQGHPVPTQMRAHAHRKSPSRQ